MTEGEDTPYLSQIHDRLAEIKALHEQSHNASEAIRAEAQEYLKQVEEPEAIDFHPFVSVPEGATVRDLADGGRLLTLVDGAMIRVNVEGGLIFSSADGSAVGLEPARGGMVRLPDGRTLTLKPEAILTTHEAAGIEGLPLDIDPLRVAEGRYRVELPDGIRLDVSHPERVVIVGNPDGATDVVGLTRMEGIGEEVEVRPVPGGAKAFEAMASGHRGIVEADGTIHLSTPNGLDLVIRFPDGGEPDRDTGRDDLQRMPCEEHD